jgi:aldehyde:ferredoxin oxidoreductase
VYGANGKILNINLSNHNIYIENIDEKLYRNFIGGSGIAANLIIKRGDINCDSLSINNP